MKRRGYPPAGFALTTGTANVVMSVVAGVAMVLVAPRVMLEPMIVAGSDLAWAIAVDSAAVATIALPPITAARIFTLGRSLRFTWDAPSQSLVTAPVGAATGGEPVGVSERGTAVSTLDCR